MTIDTTIHNFSTVARIDTAGIAKLIGCTRAHVTNRITKRLDFPKPIINLSTRTRAWRLSDVQRYIQGQR